MNKRHVFIVSFVVLITIFLTACRPQPLEKRETPNRQTNFERQQRERLPQKSEEQAPEQSEDQTNGSKQEEVQEINELVNEMNELNSSVTSLDENIEL